MALEFPIYMDYQSTTPVDPQVADLINKEMRETFGNPHAKSHASGWASEAKIEIARQQVADVINSDITEIIFTSGATESNNIALRGLAEFYGSEKNHFITLETEHKCVVNSLRYLSGKGFDITFLPVQTNGIVDLELLKQAITPKTLCVSIMGVNNEIGVIQPLEEIGKITRANGVFFHTDLAQAFGKMPIDVEKMNIDLASISSHKIYGPKGVGALYIRKNPRVRLVPLIQGGGQERGFRSGTLPTPIIAGFGLAAEIANKQMVEDSKRIGMLTEKLYNGIMELEEVYLNGDKEHRIPGNLNISFAFIEGESMILSISDLAVSSGSACTSASLEPSYVIKALGVTEDLAHTSIRFGIGRFTTEEEIDYAIQLIKGKVYTLRELSPLWEMHKEGIDISQIKWDEGH
jgi:cysteine desulfurase